uniref:Uncharacterized protein n=1 Tax=Triticum aestivum TaxID=4565 RepID=A0A077RW48_WHEAT|nr:unnamed protein product [Triticum aestivum]
MGAMSAAMVGDAGNSDGWGRRRLWDLMLGAEAAAMAYDTNVPAVYLPLNWVIAAAAFGTIPARSLGRFVLRLQPSKDPNPIIISYHELGDEIGHGKFGSVRIYGRKTCEIQLDVRPFLSFSLVVLIVEHGCLIFVLVLSFKRFVLIGRVALVNYSKDYGRLIVIVDVVDQNRNVEDTVHREVEIVQHLSGHPAVVTLKAVCGGCKSKQLKGTRRLGVRDYISLLSFIFCPKYKYINLIMGFSMMAAKRQHGVEMQVISTLKALRSVGVLGSMQSIGDVAIVLARLIRSNLGPAPAVYGALATVLSLCNCNSMLGSSINLLVMCLQTKTLLRLFCGVRGDASDQAAVAYSLGDLHKGAAKISNDILDSVGVECPTFPKMAPETCPQPEPARLPYEIQISLGTMILESKAQRKNPMICSLILLIMASTYWTPQKLPVHIPSFPSTTVLFSEVDPSFN